VREFVGVHVSEEQPGISTLVLNREPTNALTRQVYRELADAAVEVSHRADIAAVILFGGHEIFCAGDDVPELHTLDRAGAETADRIRRAALDAVAAIPKPTVAAVTGYALGAGLSLALAADWRVAGDNAKVGATEILAGLVPGGGGCDLPDRGVARRHPRWSCKTFNAWR
jgi:enoyl-CoA hydratase